MKTHCKDCIIKEEGIFSRMNKRQVDKITCIMNMNKYRKRQIVFLEGNASHYIFAIKSGTVKTFNAAEDGKIHISRVLSVGDLMGFDTIYSNEYLYSAEVLEDSEICMMRKEDFMALLMNDTEIAVEFISILTRELEKARRSTRDIAVRTASQKIAQFILSLSNASSSARAAKETVILPLTRKELAEMLALTPETVSRTFRQFEKDGIVRVSGRKILITDPRRLSLMVHKDHS